MRAQFGAPSIHTVIATVVATLLYLVVLTSNVATTERVVKEQVRMPKVGTTGATVGPQPARFVHHKRVASCWRL